MSTPGRCVVQRVHNNNVVLALDEHDRSVVVTGTGVGFGARRGTLLDPARIEAVYVPRPDVSAEAAAQILATIPPEVVGTARQIAQDVGHRIGLPHPEVMVIPLADHLHQAVRRAERGITLDIPLVWEVRQLYPAELAAGQAALDVVETRLGVRLPEAEACAVALHIVSSTFTRAPLDSTVAMTEALGAIFDLIDTQRGRAVDRQGQAAARFVTHLRYLFVRLSEGRPVPSAPPLVHDALAASVPEVMAVAREIAELLSRTWSTTVSPDETAYIGLHVHRLLADDGS